MQICNVNIQRIIYEFILHRNLYNRLIQELLIHGVN
jgi:hypothetical protein